jgi:integrase
MSKRADNEGTVFERRGRLRSDGTREPNRWVAEITIDTPEGRKRKVLYASSQAEARQRLEDAKHARRGGRISAITNQTLGDFLDHWLATIKSTVRPTTYASYDLNVRRAKRFMGEYTLESLKPADIQQWYMQLSNEGISPTSVGQARRILHIALTDALRWELIDRNPIDVTKPPRVAHREGDWLRGDEAKALFEKTKGHRLHALWVLLTTAGLRIGEALALTWSDIDPESRTLRVERAIQRQTGKGLVFVETKTAKSRRSIQLTTLAADALQRHHEQQDYQRSALADEWRGRDLIFCTDYGLPLDSTNVSQTLHRALKANGLRQIGLHELRHSAASLMLAEGVPLKVVQEVLGHSSYTLTANTYSHIAPELQRDAANRLDSLFMRRPNADRQVE